MLNTIKLQTSRLYAQKGLRFCEISVNSLNEFSQLKSRSQQMLVDILSLVGYKSEVNSLIVEITYKELGFASQSNMNKYKKELLNNRWLFADNNKYYINPCKINYYTRRQREYFFGLFKLKSSPKVVMNQPKIISIN